MHAVDSGTATLKDALNEAMRDWVTNIDDTYYIIGSVTGPHPYPMIVRDFNSIVGRELRDQSIEHFNAFPEAIIASANRKRYAGPEPLNPVTASRVVSSTTTTSPTAERMELAQSR